MVHSNFQCSSKFKPFVWYHWSAHGQQQEVVVEIFFTWTRINTWEPQCTLPPINTWGMGVLYICNQPYGILGACPLGRQVCQPTCLQPFKVFTFKRRHYSSRGPLILVKLILGSHINLDQLGNEATPQLMPVATSKPSSFSREPHLKEWSLKYQKLHIEQLVPNIIQHSNHPWRIIGLLVDTNQRLWMKCSLRGLKIAH